MASLLRRVATRAVLAGGVAAVVGLLVQDCSARHHEVTIVVDPRPLGDGVRAVRVDLFDRDGAVGSIERRFRSGEARSPVRLEAAAPGADAELVIEVETDDGPRRRRDRLTVSAGSVVRVRLGGVALDDAPAAAPDAAPTR